MEAELEVEFRPYNLEWVEKNVDEDPEFLRCYGDSVPVLLRDGVAKAKGRFKPGQLRRIIFRRR